MTCPHISFDIQLLAKYNEEYMNGYKTYLVCAVALAYAATGFFSGNLDANAAMQIVLAALGAAGLRHGIANQA